MATDQYYLPMKKQRSQMYQQLETRLEPLQTPFQEHLHKFN